MYLWLHVLLASLGKAAGPEPRIYEGLSASPGQFPYVAFLNISRTTCTGSLISPSWVLTAGHCVNNENPKKIVVTAGDPDRTSEWAQVRRAYRTVIHPDFEEGSHDLALVRVKSPFDMSTPGIGLLELSNDEWLPEEVLSCYVVGYGRTAITRTPRTLQYLEVVAAKDGCPCADESLHVCVLSEEGSGPCFGDSGGPLVCAGRGYALTQAAVHSETCQPWGKRGKKFTCGDPEYVVYFQDLCPQLDWMRQHVTSIPPAPISCQGASVQTTQFYFLVILTVLIKKLN